MTGLVHRTDSLCRVGLKRTQPGRVLFWAVPAQHQAGQRLRLFENVPLVTNDGKVSGCLTATDKKARQHEEALCPPGAMREALRGSRSGDLGWALGTETSSGLCCRSPGGSPVHSLPRKGPQPQGTPPLCSVPRTYPFSLSPHPWQLPSALGVRQLSQAGGQQEKKRLSTTRSTDGKGLRGQ